MRMLVNLALLLAALFTIFTQAGNDLAADVFMRAHEQLMAYITGIVEDSL
jgi:multisubunit Na+/H+ antiporter MnhG subunit